MNACPPEDLSAYEQTSTDPNDLVSAFAVVGDADDSSSVPTAPLEGDAGMAWIGPDPLD